jgi:hypothetical protein
MNRFTHASPSMPSWSALGDRVATALRLLLAADAAAKSSKRDRWQFAVETQEFLDVGVLKTDLRWLVSMGYAELTRPSPA